MPERVEHLAHESHLLAQDVGRRLAVGLVVGVGSWRKVGSGRSKATSTPSGFCSLSTRISIDVNPNTALVT